MKINTLRRGLVEAGRGAHRPAGGLEVTEIDQLGQRRRRVAAAGNRPARLHHAVDELVSLGQPVIRLRRHARAATQQQQRVTDALAVGRVLAKGPAPEHRTLLGIQREHGGDALVDHARVGVRGGDRLDHPVEHRRQLVRADVAKHPPQMAAPLRSCGGGDPGLVPAERAAVVHLRQQAGGEPGNVQGRALGEAGQRLGVGRFAAPQELCQEHDARLRFEIVPADELRDLGDVDQIHLHRVGDRRVPSIGGVELGDQPRVDPPGLVDLGETQNRVDSRR